MSQVIPFKVRLTLACAALGLGLGLGVLWHDVAKGLNRELVAGLHFGLDWGCQMALAAFAVTILRTAEPRKVWIAAAVLSAPIVGAQHASAYHPLLILLAESTWFLTIVACARDKRTLGTWCILACAACTTSMKISSRMVDNEIRASSSTEVRVGQ
jgi:hypothetical protein